jgi:hypothetical protein
MRVVPRFVALVTAMFVCAIGAGSASAKPHPKPHAKPHAPGGGARIVPAHVVRGLTGGELIGAGFAADYVRPVDTPSPDCRTLGRRDDILLMTPTGTTITCTVKPGTPILVFGLGSACSNIEGPPFYGEDAAAQEDCAREFNRTFALGTQVSIDGRRPVDLLTDRFEVTSPQRTVVLPENNFLGQPAGTVGTLVAVAYIGVVRGLTPGQHTIVNEIVTPEFADATTLIVNVVPGA